MEIKIDTSKDSIEDIRRIIDFLSKSIEILEGTKAKSNQKVDSSPVFNKEQNLEKNLETYKETKNVKTNVIAIQETAPLIAIQENVPIIAIQETAPTNTVQSMFVSPSEIITSSNKTQPATTMQFTNSKQKIIADEKISVDEKTNIDKKIIASEKLDTPAIKEISHSHKSITSPQILITAPQIAKSLSFNPSEPTTTKPTTTKQTKSINSTKPASFFTSDLFTMFDEPVQDVAAIKIAVSESTKMPIVKEYTDTIINNITANQLIEDSMKIEFEHDDDELLEVQELRKKSKTTGESLRIIQYT